ncbi:MAG TPA: peptide-methionine (S)-S-oxide reductase MsrA [Flavobacteriaceae bacterium]|nr:peptide-methionine (S)-S-oxide reductase MsrA [Flavobacteriaceae bacterium]
MKTMTIGGGCFWCTEAVFDRVKGVEKVVPGYAGGTVPGTPTYREVCSGLTGHAEVIQVSFDPEIISYKELLEIFMTTHDPTTLNRQGADVGTQYRSVIFYHDEHQKEVAESVLSEMGEVYENRIVTELKPFEKFFPAEKEHYEYYARKPEQAYCQYVISPKVAKLKKLYADKVK